MKNAYSKLLYFLLFAACVLPGCNTINPHEQTPTYIHIDSFQFLPDVQHVTTSHEITTVWAYYNNQPVGEFDLPATFPIQTNGTAPGQVTLAPGVVVDGLNSLLSAYPFYSSDTTTITQQPGKVITIHPSTTFFPKAKIYSISNFEGGLGFSLAGGNIPMIISSGGSAAYEGNSSGTITLSAVGDSSIDSSLSFPIPQGDAFIEFNYKSDLQFYVGMQVSQSGISSTPYYLAGIQPSTTWRKFYLSVADFAAQFKGTAYNFYIKTSLSAGISKGTLYLDNIQLVTY